MYNLPHEVYVARDYSKGVEPTRFERVIPKELEQRVSEHDFLILVDTINDFFREAEEVGWKTFLEGLFGCLSCFAIFLFYKSTYKRAMERMHEFIHEQNQTVFLPRGVRVKNPLFNGTLHLEFLVYPQPK